MAIVEDNLSLADQFREGLNTYFVIKNPEFLNIISRLKIKKLSKLVEKKIDLMPDVTSLEINNDYTLKVRRISKLLTRIETENSLLDKHEWAEIDPEVIVYQLNELSVLKYVTWNGTKHFSSNNNINCYIEKKIISLVISM